ncbi:SDR family oxidoreductase [Microlunatus flavus]|uniref:Short-chain dehydrogenase n=1 Tax=Microlunatus flavus TaxID=1036181 RepID=A0A1H9B879_9ACTN|nr:SDR family NAD(P)-dependent oxidoreductase [Microlunatus flavus]SEP85025.1 Short-chain dehydrogenase [Microlunatus flavus]
MELEGAVVVVTGASAGIGAATARMAGERGAHVVLAARRREPTRRLADELASAVAVPCDVTQPVHVEELIRTTLATFGRVDVLVNNAGQGLHARVEDTDPADLRALLELNLLAPLALMRAVIPVMRRQGAGSIVNVSSGTTLADAPSTGGYVASKIALERLSAIARAELAGAGVAVSTMIPFVTSTEFVTSLRRGSDAAADELAGVTFDPPERVAEAILELVRSGEPVADLVPAAYGGSR